MVNRMRPIMMNIISPFQNAFTPGRRIQDNILLVHEMLHTMRKTKNKKGAMALKLDLSKAYDQIEWNFIENTLKLHDFPNWWITRIMQCIKTVTYKILINGKRSKTVVPSRGIRQGDPLSPYLFLLVIDQLTRNLANAGQKLKPLRDL